MQPFLAKVVDLGDTGWKGISGVTGATAADTHDILIGFCSYGTHHGAGARRICVVPTESSQRRGAAQ